MDLPSKAWFLISILIFCLGVHAKDLINKRQNGVRHDNIDLRETVGGVLNAGIDDSTTGLNVDVHEGRLMEEAPGNGEDENDTVNDKDKAKHDLAWEKHSQLIFDPDAYNATASLLRLYGCTIYSDEFGIETAETASNSAIAISTASAAYSKIPNDDETWALFEEANRFAMGKATLPLPQNSEKQQQQDAQPEQRFSASRGMKIPFEIRYNPKIGRSVHVTEFVPKGTLVWTSSHVAAFTKDKEEEALSSGKESLPRIRTYRRFLEYLHNHSRSSSSGNGNDDDTYNWACDALMWTYPVCEMAVCVGFNHGSLFNDAKDNETAITLFGFECDKNEVAPNDVSEAMDSDCPCFKMEASRDIMPGEGVCVCVCVCVCVANYQEHRFEIKTSRHG
jgi:hypothetical protein